VVDIREPTSPDDLDAAFVLRHRICVGELAWVRAQHDGHERDEWDDGALHIGAFTQPQPRRMCPGGAGLGRARDHDPPILRGLVQRHDPRPPVAVTGDMSRLVLDAEHVVTRGSGDG